MAAPAPKPPKVSLKEKKACVSVVARYGCFNWCWCVGDYSINQAERKKPFLARFIMALKKLSPLIVAFLAWVFYKM